MPLQDLGQVQTNQSVLIPFESRAVDERASAPFNLPFMSVSPSGALTFDSVQQDGPAQFHVVAHPTGSQIGQVIVITTAQRASNLGNFNTQATLTIVNDPNPPAPPDHFVFGTPTVS